MSHLNSENFVPSQNQDGGAEIFLLEMDEFSGEKFNQIDTNKYKKQP